MILPANRLVLSGAELGSPGFWEFLGSMNPLEIIRKYLQDRHERRKDLEYRNEQERREKEVEILLDVTELMEKCIELAKRAGAPSYIVASLFNELVGRPLAALGELQDRGLLITGIPERLTGGTTAAAKSR